LAVVQRSHLESVEEEEFSHFESFARRRDVRWLTPSGVADSTFEPITGAPTRLNASS